MSEKKIKDPVTLFASIEREDHDSLRELSFLNHRSIADLTRDAIKEFVEENLGKESKKASAKKQHKTARAKA
jgi:hypothetical protein